MRDDARYLCGSWASCYYEVIVMNTARLSKYSVVVFTKTRLYLPFIMTYVCSLLEVRDEEWFSQWFDDEVNSWQIGRRRTTSTNWCYVKKDGCVRWTRYEERMSSDAAVDSWSWAAESADCEPLHKNAYSLVIRTTTIHTHPPIRQIYT